jgi:enoyl-CoA hydratase/carnithine racemase
VSDAPSYIDLEVDGTIATLVLNRPEKRNAWSWESARQIAAHADALRFRDDVRVVVVRAEGRSFCAGVDLGMPADRLSTRRRAEFTSGLVLPDRIHRCAGTLQADRKDEAASVRNRPGAGLAV